MRKCRICSGLAQSAQADDWNKPLLESESFVALPSLGALVEGWLLLIPKRHFISMGALPKPLVREMNEMKRLAYSVVEECYGRASIFEHGASKPNCAVGCGVDHAHLHFVPLQFRLAPAVAAFLPSDASWSEGGIDQCREAFLRGEEYLYLEQPLGVGRIFTSGTIGSQLFRRAIASRIGLANESNWKDYPQVPNVMATIERIRVWTDNARTCEGCSGARM